VPGGTSEKLGVLAAGVTALDRPENGPGPTRLTACTRNRYSVPLVSPSTRRLVASGPATRGRPIGLPPASWTSIWKPVSATLPVSAGAVHVTVAAASPAVADPMTGAPGMVALVATGAVAGENTVSAVPWPSVYRTRARICRPRWSAVGVNVLARVPLMFCQDAPPSPDDCHW